MALRLLPEVRWSQLIDTTLEILEEVPGCEVVIDDIAARAEVSRSLVYRYFDGVDDLLQHVQRRFFAPLRTELAQVLQSQQDLLDQLHGIIATTVHFAAEHPSAFCHLVDGGLPRSANHDPLIGPMQKLTAVVRPDPDAVLVATATAALIESAILAWLRDDRTDATAVIGLLFRLTAPGFLRPPPTSNNAHTDNVAGHHRAPPAARTPTGAYLTLVSTEAQPHQVSAGLETTPMTMKENP